MDINGKTVLVTGANRGLGAAIVDAFVREGARRVYAAARKPDLTSATDVVRPVQLDITDDARVRALAAELGDVEILVNNAGVSLYSAVIGAADTRDAEQEMRVNYFGVLSMVRAFAPVLGKNGGGAIVNVLSILARVTHPAVGTYCASKAATFSLSQAVRFELAPQKTLVIRLMPGFIDTEMANNVTANKMSPADVASALIEAFRSETEDAYPGPASDLANLLKQKDPNEVSKMLVQMASKAFSSP